MEVVESQLEFVLDKSYSNDLSSFIKDTTTTRIKGFIDHFLDTYLNRREEMAFEEFRQKFDEYIYNDARVCETDITDFSTDEMIEICRLADDLGCLSLGNSEVFYDELPRIISKDCCVVLDQLINQECSDFIYKLKNIMEKMNFKISQMTDDNNLGWMRHEKELEPNHYTQVYCYRCVEGEMDLNIDVYEVRFSGFNVYFEKDVEIPLDEQERNYEIYL